MRSVIWNVPVPIDFFDAVVGLNSTYSSTLLGQKISTAVLPHTFQLPFVKPQVSEQWLKSIHAGHFREASSHLITRCAVSEKWTAAQVATTLQHAAQILMSLNCVPDANRCVQESLASLATSREQVRPEFDVQRWVTLSNIALAGQDHETAELWLRQSSRTLTGHSTELHSSALNHYLGDLLAIKACLSFDPDDSDNAAATLSDAHRAHINAGSMLSAVLDLVLQSRCHREHKRTVTRQLLERAKETLATVDTTRHNMAVCDALSSIIHDDTQALMTRKPRPVPALN
jgi:hypothetical protein